ncbi:MAG TPA: DUF1177 domain-containing protein [Halanaerobiales bacterium]|nr:DUF1177 domain-containing protein [Halanaerobiales bacterium]
MILKQILEIFELLDKPNSNGAEMADFLKERGAENVYVTSIQGKNGYTDGIKIYIAGKNGKKNGGNAPTLGIIGRLGGIGARPLVKGFVSDGDGALTVLSAALKLIEMKTKGDQLEGDIIITTHICPNAPTIEHKPVPFMGSPIDMRAMNEHEVLPEMEAILSVDTTKGNKIVNSNGFAISPTIKEGYILKISDDLLTIMEKVTGNLPLTIPVSQQDITPYGNDLFHINSLYQPSTATKSPLIGVAITTGVPVAGCASGASHFGDIEKAGRFLIETAKAYGNLECEFYDRAEFEKILKLYGKMNRFQTMGIK